MTNPTAPSLTLRQLALLSGPGPLARRFSFWRQQRDRQRRFEKTYASLQALSDKDLADIGLSRLSLRDIAWEKAFGTPEEAPRA